MLSFHATVGSESSGSLVLPGTVMWSPRMKPTGTEQGPGNEREWSTDPTWPAACHPASSTSGLSRRVKHSFSISEKADVS